MSSMLRVIQQRYAFHKPLISKHIYSYALPQSELLGNGAITPLLTGQFMEDRPQGFPNGAVQGLPAPLGHKHHVILAIPPGMRQALIGVRHRVLLRCALIKPPEENSTPGSLKALLVSLVKPVAYLKY